MWNSVARPLVGVKQGRPVIQNGLSRPGTNFAAMMDDLELRRRRAVYRACHRGTKEMDVLLGRFTVACVAGMGDADLAHFERFLALPDPMLQTWIFDPGAMIPSKMGPSEFLTNVVALRRFHGLEGPVADDVNKDEDGSAR